MERKLIAYSLPIFAIAILIDFLIDHFKKTNRYKIDDSITSLSAGFLGTSLGLLTLGFVGFFYNGVYNFYHAFKISDSVLSWLLAAFIYDFLYYWFHRAHHRINIFWASHATHHNSEYFNFSTALRQSALGFLTVWPFFIPMAFFGFSYEQYLFAAGLSTLYGFFTHTEAIKYRPYFELVFIGPSSHRVHHGTNGRYIDKNYGSILSIWDRMFKTYAQEDESEKIQFGTITPLNSFNPFWANLSFFWFLFHDAFKTKSYSSKFLLWFKETGWRPQDLRTQSVYEAPKVRIRESHIGLNELLYVIFSFGLTTLGMIYLFLTAKSHTYTWIFVYVMFLWLALLSHSFFFEKNKYRFKFEFFRLTLTGLMAFFAFSGFVVSH